MPVPDTVYLSTPTDTSTSALGVAGEIRQHIDADLGMQYYKVVKNTSGSTIDAGKLCAFASGSAINVGLGAEDTLAPACAGVAVVSIANNSYGWVVCRGQVKCDSTGATTATEYVRPAASGEVSSDAAASSDTEAAQMIGVWVEAGAATALRTANITIS